jgi:hypothetical protein
MPVKIAKDSAILNHILVISMFEYMIRTKNLGLRLFSKSDVDDLVKLNSDPDVIAF